MALEADVQGDISGVQVQGRISVLGLDSRIIDPKTASRKPSGIMPKYRFQIATYATLHGIVFVLVTVSSRTEPLV